MSLQPCNDITEATALEPSLGLYLKPSFKIKISVQLPSLKTPGQSISMWEVMEKIKTAISPEKFLFLKVTKTNSTHIQLEGEHETQTSYDRALQRLQSARGIKLANFPDWLQVQAVISTNTHPSRHDWTAFFRDARGMDEMKPGERPDTVYLRDIPVGWFAQPGSTVPCERLLRKTFQVFGKLRQLEVPVSSGGAFGKVSTLHKELLFEVYIQYEEYDGFVRAMETLRGQKLLHKDEEGKICTVQLKVDFDRSNYLSDKCINLRKSEQKKRLLEQEKVTSINHTVASTSDSDVTTSIPSKKVLQERMGREAEYLLKELLRRAEIAELKAEKQKNVQESAKSNNEMTKSNIETTKSHSEIEKGVSGTEMSSSDAAECDSKTVKSNSETSKLNKETVKVNNETVTSNNKSSKSNSECSKSNKESSKSINDVAKSKKQSSKHINEGTKSNNEGTKYNNETSKSNRDNAKSITNSVTSYSRGIAKRNQEILLQEERTLRDKLLKKMKDREERRKEKLREKLRKEIARKKNLKSVLVKTTSRKRM